MRRRRRPPDSSLELLLDTICNTFGGVLFLAILVSVMLRVTSKSEATIASTPQVSAAQIVELAQQFAKLDARAAGLRTAMENQQKLAAQFVRPDKAKKLNNLHELRTEFEAANNERSKLLEEIAAHQAKTQEANSRLAELDDELTQSTKEAEAAAIALKSEIESRTKSAKLPRLRFTSKREIGLILRYGRFYLWHRYGRAGERLGLNTADFVVVSEERGALITSPKPYAGIDLMGRDSSALLKSSLGSFNPKQECLCLTVWPDSFDVFQKLKGELVELGYEYRLMLITEGNSVVDRGGSGGRVQ